MTPIETLIESQINQLSENGLEEKLKGILLVGGLSRSEYVYRRIHDGYADKRMKVWRADDAWTAVARGAVYSETTVVHSRLSRRNYGILYREAGERRIHWIVRKGQSVKSNMPTEPYALRIDDQPWLNEDESFWVSVTLVRYEVAQLSKTPYGSYARQVLISLPLWDSDRMKTMPQTNSMSVTLNRMQ